MQVKSDMGYIVRGSRETVFTPVDTSASFASSGIFQLDKERAVNGLSGRSTKPKE